MPRLIHLNGPPGIGKSTIADIYVGHHTGVLDLDIDRLRCLIGGWRERFGETGELVRPLALTMARTHLARGYDVVMPQYLGRIGEVERFERAATESDAAYVHVMLTDGRERSVERFYDRGGADGGAWHGEVVRIVERSGGRALLADMHDRLTEVLRSRPEALVVHSEPGESNATYDAVMVALGQREQTVR